MPLDNAALGRRAEPPPQVVKQAIHWLLRLRNNHGNPRLSRQCEQWRAEHHEHELAWQRVQSLQAELSSNLRAVPGAQVAFNTLENSAQGLSRRQALKLLSGALLLGSAAWLAKDSGAWQQWSADYATATGEQRGFQLPDGTRIELNTASAVDLQYTAQQRLIKLTRARSSSAVAAPTKARRSIARCACKAVTLRMRPLALASFCVRTTIAAGSL